MIKKIFIYSSLAVLLNACAVNPDELTATDFANEAKMQVNYDSVDITGVSFKAFPLDKAIGVVKSTAHVIAHIPDNVDEQATSKIVMELRYFDNDFTYVFAEVDNEKVELKPISLTIRECTESCQYLQHFSFPVSTQSLIKAKKTGYQYKITDNKGSKQLAFTIPGQYIEGLLLASSKQLNNNTVQAKQKMPAEQSQSAIQMSQDLFSKATDVEKEQFTDWAFKNRKSITTPLNGEGKILTMLEYWYEKATADEKAEILTWVLAQ